MNDIPRPALILALAGLIPFLAGAMSVAMPEFLPRIGRFGGTAADGRALLALYGTVIVCFMSGCLWGFASRHGRKPGWLELGASVLPPLFVFFFVADDATSCLILTYAFAGLLLIECWFARRAVVVWWWLSLRIPLTVVVSICLLIGAFA